MCVCGGGGGGLVTSFKVNFNFPKFQGVQHMLSGGGGGGGRQTFFQGGGVQLLSGRFALDPCPHSRSTQLLSRILIDYGDSLDSSFIMYPLT